MEKREASLLNSTAINNKEKRPLCCPDYAMMRRGEVFVMFMEENCFQEDLPFLKGVPNGASLSFYIDVEGINALYESLKDKVEIVKELHTTWYGMDEFYIEDCNGYVLGFGEKS